MRWLLYDGSRFVMKDSGKVTIGQINPTDPRNEFAGSNDLRGLPLNTIHRQQQQNTSREELVEMRWQTHSQSIYLLRRGLLLARPGDPQLRQRTPPSPLAFPTRRGLLSARLVEY